MITMNKKQSQGFSLVELMVAMVVGLIIISGVFALHVATRDAQKVNEAQMDMVADARFAIELISYDLRHAGMWGGTNDPNLIDCRADDAACTASPAGEFLATAAVNDCAAAGDPLWAFDLRQPVFATNGVNPYDGSCISGTGGEAYVVGTDVLEIHYADSSPLPQVISPLLPNQAYIRSNAMSGRVYVGTTEPEVDIQNDSPMTMSHELYAYAYYISNFTDSAGDGIPSLRRAALVNGPAVQNQVLVSGVANLQVQLGEDVNDDQVVDRYVNPNAVTNWKNVVSAKIWLVMQTDKQQQGIDTSKTFNIAGVDTPYGGVNGFRHFMVSSVVDLRNVKQLVRKKPSL